MVVTLHRTQILLEPRQYRELSDIARRERRSLSELVREAVERELERRQEKARDVAARWDAWFERSHELGEQILARRGGRRLDVDTAELLNQLRDERIDELIANTALRHR